MFKIFVVVPYICLSPLSLSLSLYRHTSLHIMMNHFPLHCIKTYRLKLLTWGWDCLWGIPSPPSLQSVLRYWGLSLMTHFSCEAMWIPSNTCPAAQYRVLSETANSSAEFTPRGVDICTRLEQPPRLKQNGQLQNSVCNDIHRYASRSSAAHVLQTYANINLCSFFRCSLYFQRLPGFCSHVCWSSYDHPHCEPMWTSVVSSLPVPHCICLCQLCGAPHSHLDTSQSFQSLHGPPFIGLVCNHHKLLGWTVQTIDQDCCQELHRPSEVGTPNSQRGFHSPNTLAVGWPWWGMTLRDTANHKATVQRLWWTRLAVQVCWTRSSIQQRFNKC